MASSTIGSDAAPAPSEPSVSNNLPTSKPNNGIGRMSKIRELEFLRLMADNQAVLQQSQSNMKAQAQLDQQLQQAQAQKAAQAMGQSLQPTPSTNGDAVGDFSASIDSPVTHVHNYPAATPAPVSAAPVATANPAPSLLSKLAPWLAAAGLGAGGAGLGYGLANKSAPVVTNSSTASGFNLQLEHPK